MNPTDKNQSIDTRERIRRSFDKVKVINPFDFDTSVVWDGFHHIVKAHSYAILDRFLGEKWLEERCKQIITEKADKAVKAENKRRVANGMAQMDKTRKTGEQYEFETPFYANWTAGFKDVIKEYGLYGGIVEEYGMSYTPPAQPENRDLNRSLIDELEAPQREVKVAPPLPGGLIDDLESKDVFTLRKIAREKGITTSKTDKKADLIKAISA